MGKNKSKRIISIIALVLILAMVLGTLASALAGCGAASVDISDEDVKRVANYSSDIVSQHNDKSDSRLVDLATVKRKYQQQLDLEIKRQNFRAMEQAAANGGTESGDGSGSDSGSGNGEETEENVQPDMTLSEAIGVP